MDLRKFDTTGGDQSRRALVAGQGEIDSDGRLTMTYPTDDGHTVTVVYRTHLATTDTRWRSRGCTR